MYCHILLWNKVKSYDRFLQFAEVYLLLSQGKSYRNAESNARSFLSWHASSDVQNYFAGELQNMQVHEESNFKETS